MRPEYMKYVSDKLKIPIEDLSDIEMEIINITFDLFKEKVNDIKILNDDINKLQNVYLNLKSSLDDNNY
jgi:hypothetical protein